MGLHRGAWALALALVAASSGDGSRVSAANPPSAETLLDRVVARLGEVSPAFDTQGLLAVTVIRFDTPEWASFQGAEQFKSASVVKALWVAAALDHAGVEAAAPIAAASLYGSSNDAAGRAMDIAGGIDAVNEYAHNLGLAETTAYEWLFGRQRRSVDFPGPVRGLNLTTTDDLAGFWAAVGYGLALGPEEGAALLEWTRGPKDSGEGSRLIARLPAEVGENASFKMGWLPVGREYELQDDETGWGGEPPGTVVTFDRGAIDAGAGIVTTPDGASYAIAVASYDGRLWKFMTGWVEYVSCVVYSVVAEDPIDCVRGQDPLAIRERRAVPSGELQTVLTRTGFVRVAGWAVDPDAWWQPTRVAITFDGVVVAQASARPTGGEDLFAPRFAREFPFEGGEHEVCAVALNDGNGEDTPIGCHTISL